MMRWRGCGDEPEREDGDRVRTLIVDDSEDDALLLEAGLARHGLAIEWRRVDTAIDMAAALATEAWDLVLADHAMPGGFDARAALAVLVRSGRDLPFIVHSGRVPAQLGAALMVEGVSDFVVKGDCARLAPVIERELRACRDRRALRAADRRIRDLAHFDLLSRLPNHGLFCAKVEDWFDTCRRSGRTPRAATLVVDVDRFMRINTSVGYAAGSRILREVARRLTDALVSSAVLARLGGDRFGVFLAGRCDEGQAERVARRLMRAFEQPFEWGDGELLLTASVGIAMMSGGEAVIPDILIRAEAAVADAKREGGNSVRIYDRSMSRASAARLQLEIDLRRSVPRGELRLYYQPIVDADSCHARGAEALVRWLHPVRGMLGPDRFIPLADETGLIIDIGAWVLGEACRQGRRWHDAGRAGFHLSVNVSPIQFSQLDLLAQVEHALAHSGFPPHCLTLEITETSLMSDVEAAGRTLRALKALGVRVAIDDFGTGYSSLSRVHGLPIDTLKIDKEFVGDLTRDPDDEAITATVITMAHSLGLNVIAEGVESDQQLAYLREQGCDEVQGFWLSPPLDAHRCLAFMRTWQPQTVSMVPTPY